tara:strand:+ start:32 stop:1147 length:1116 start_codon:yes stop_codon:yes gene_type:complete
MIEEQKLLDVLPITLLFGYISYKFLDNYFYSKYFYLNKDLDDLYYDINGTMYKVDTDKLIPLKPLECSKNLLNFNKIQGDYDDSDDSDDSGDSDDSDDSGDSGNSSNYNSTVESNIDQLTIKDNVDNVNFSKSFLNDIENEVFLNITNDEIEQAETENKEIEENELEKENNDNIDIENYQNYNVFIMTNYSEQIKKTNNPFYKDLNIVVDVLFDKNTENEDLDKYLEQLNDWKLEDVDHEYYKLEIISNNVEYIFDNLFLVLNKYYSIHSNVNVIFNHNQLNDFKKNIFTNISSYKIVNNKPTYKYLNFNFISMYDLYGYINNEKNELNYDNINFEKFQDLIDYYNLESVNLENTEDKDSGVFESILNKFY